MKTLRIAAISFLNTAPLMWEFEQGRPAGTYEIRYTLPPQCAEMLRTGEADIGIIPAAAYASIPGLAIVPGVAIAAKGPVRSIYLISKVPVELIGTVATDTSSRSSVALLRILFEKHWKRTPEFIPMAPELGPMIARCDAGLLIGDPALITVAGQKPGEFHVYDLAEEWIRFTGLPFVFAFWAVRRAAIEDAAMLVKDFQRSRDSGLKVESIEAIAREWAPKLQLGEKVIKDYLREAIFYGLDEECLTGLSLFFQLAEECKLLPKLKELKFL